MLDQRQRDQDQTGEAEHLSTVQDRRSLVSRSTDFSTGLSTAQPTGRVALSAYDGKRRAAALRMRTKGLTKVQIARRLDVSNSRVDYLLYGRTSRRKDRS